MANIPTVALSAVPAAGALGPMANEGTANAVNQAITQAGGALGQIANQIFNIAQKRQEHINKGILANEEVIFENTQQAIMKNAEDNRGNPEKLTAMADSTWTQYEAGRAKRAVDQGYTRDMRDGLDNRFSVGIARFNTVFKGKVQGLEIQKANSYILARAQKKASQGDLPGAYDTIDEMNVFADQKAELKQTFGINDIINKTNSHFNTLSQQPLAFQIAGYDEVAKHFTAKGKDGSYVFKGYEDKDGNLIRILPVETRNQIVSKALAELEQAGNQEISNIKPVLKVFEENGNVAGSKVLIQKVLAGDISQATADKYASIFSSSVAAGEQDRAQKQLPDSRRQEATYQTLLGKIDEATTEQITQQIKLGGITEDQGKRLMGIMNTRAITEMDPATQLMTNRGFMYAGNDPRKFLDKYAKDNADINREGSVKSKSELLKAINDSPVSAEAKRRMTARAIQLFEADFRDVYQSTAPIKKGGMMESIGNIFHRSTKRAISPREADVRSLVYRNMRVAGDLGQPYTIDYLIEAERGITSHFENKANGEPQHAQLENSLKDRLANLTGQAIVRESLFP